MDYTFGKPIHYDPYQVDIVKGLLTRNIQVRFGDVRNEIVTAFEELLPPQDGIGSLSSFSFSDFVQNSYPWLLPPPSRLGNDPPQPDYATYCMQSEQSTFRRASIVSRS